MTHIGPVPPMPAELINDCPAVATMSALELGALWALAHAFWRAGAVPLPNEDAALSVLARCHTRRWYDVRAAVLPVWRALEPTFVSVYAEKVAKLDNVRAAALANLELANVAGRSKRAAQKGAGVQLGEGNGRVVPLSPAKRNAPFVKKSTTQTALLSD